MQEDELSKCKNYMSYFIERYCKLLTPNGIENIRLLASQKKYLDEHDCEEYEVTFDELSNFKPND
jgi:hypothetical protein